MDMISFWKYQKSQTETREIRDLNDPQTELDKPKLEHAKQKINI